MSNKFDGENIYKEDMKMAERIAKEIFKILESGDDDENRGKG